MSFIKLKKNIEISIWISDYLEGPYQNSKNKLKVYNKKKIAMQTRKKISLGSLPARYIKIKCTNG